MNNALVIAGLLVPIISGLTQAIKKSFSICEQHPEVTSLLIGVIAGFLLSIGFGFAVAEMLLAGILGGLGASGLYDNLKGGK